MKNIKTVVIVALMTVCIAFGVFGIVKVVVPDKPTMPVATQMSDVTDP